MASVDRTPPKDSTIVQPNSTSYNPGSNSAPDKLPPLEDVSIHFAPSNDNQPKPPTIPKADVKKFEKSYREGVIPPGMPIEPD